MPREDTDDLCVRVLVVDDDKDLLWQVEMFLEKCDYQFEIVTVTSVTDALKLIEEQHFDAIVCDYLLAPGDMNGLELLEWIRNAGLQTPFIMFTGRSSEDVAIRALNLGADFYLIKGIDMPIQLFNELGQQIVAAVKRRMESSEMSGATAELQSGLNNGQLQLLSEMVKIIDQELHNLKILCDDALKTANKTLYDQIHAVIIKINTCLKRIQSIYRYATKV